MIINSRNKQKNNKAIIIYDTKFRITKKVAMALCRGLEAANLEVDCVFINDLDLNVLNNCDLIGIGGSTHFRRATKKIRLFFSKIKLMELKKTYFFVFETKSLCPFSGSAAKYIAKKIKNLQLNMIDLKITGTVINSRKYLEKNTLIKMEYYGIQIAEMIN